MCYTEWSPCHFKYPPAPIHIHHIIIDYILYPAVSISVCFVTINLYCLMSSHLLPWLPHPLQCDSCQSVLRVYTSVSILFAYVVHKITHISKITWHLCFPLWFISLAIIHSRSIHAIAKNKNSLKPIVTKTALHWHKNTHADQ